jgi:multisubunit Na+/H+ antiporter MnhF subunit
VRAVNAWLWAATALLVVPSGPALLVAARGSALSRLVGLELLSATLVLVLLALSQGYARTSYLDVALVLAILSFTGTLVFTRLLGRAA